MPKRSSHQDRIIRNYYQNQDAIMLQKLGDLVADLYLAEGKSRAGLWKRVTAALTNLKIPAARIEHLLKTDNPALLADLLQELLGETVMDHAETLERLRWQKFPVLDDGFVCLVDAMGDDLSVVQAARVSYGQGTRHVSDDRTLIRYLLRHWHTTPFEMVELKFLVRVPMDCWRQWIRHRMASVSEYSTRYSIAIDAAQSTPPDGWRLQAQANAQGSAGRLDAQAGQALSDGERALQQHAHDEYQRRLAAGVAREQARKDLPLSTYTEAYWKIDLHNLLHFLRLRMDARAQDEIRQYAITIGQEIVQPLFPLAWEAFVDYHQEAIQLTRLDRGVIARLAAAGRIPAPERDFLAAQDPAWASLERCRERDECRAKLARLGIVASGPPFAANSEQEEPHE